MSEKVKLTKKQAEAIEYISVNNIGENVMTQLNGHWDDKRSVLHELHLDDFINALYIGYEVEEKYKIGDWVVLKDGHVGEIEFINEDEGWANIGYSKDTKERNINLGNTYKLEDIVRFATQEEIEIEKERRWWKRRKRKVWELITKDEIRNKATQERYDVVNRLHESVIMERVNRNSDGSRTVITVNRDSINSLNYEVVCLAENREDI